MRGVEDWRDWWGRVWVIAFIFFNFYIIKTHLIAINDPFEV